MHHSASGNTDARKHIFDQAGRRLVDSIIRQRLTSEMPNIKQNVQSLVRANDPFQQKKKEVIVKRRLISIGTEEKEKVRRSVDFSPLGAINDDQSQQPNIRQKLMQSPLISLQQGEELNCARLMPDNLYVKMGGLTKPRYQASPMQSAEQAFRTLQPSLHLADKHYVVSVLEHQQLPRHSSVRSEHSAKNSFVKMLPTDRQTIQLYQPKKFNKLDMQSLDKWLEQSLQQLAEEKLPDHIYLHRLFGTYICGLKQFVRLTYIDSIDRAALLEKLLWRFVATFDGLMQLQHSVNYQQFRDHSRQFNEMKAMYQQRQRDAQERLAMLKSSHEQLNQRYNRLVVVFMSYKTLNRQLVYEVEEYHRTLQQLKDAHEHLKHQHFKLLKELDEGGRINQLRGKYYVVNEFNQPQVISHFIGGTDSYKKFQQELIRHKEVQTQLNKYWSQVQEDFIVGKMVQMEELFPRTAEIGMQSETIQTHYEEIGLQNYSLKSHLSDISIRSEDQFDNFLGKELEAQKKEEEHNALVVSLRELYDQVYTDNMRLKGVNHKLEKQIQKENEYNASLLREMTQLRQKNLWQESVVKQTRLQIDGLHRDISNKESTIQQLTERVSTAEADLKSERFNNQVFVKNQMQLRKRIEKMDKDHITATKDLDSQVKQLKIKIGKAAKLVNQYLDLIEDSNDGRYTDLGDRLQKLFKQDLDRSQKEQKETPGPFLTSK